MQQNKEMPSILPRIIKGRSGFTLVEMSIVLVIIGLIVAGVLVGQDMINAAAIRAQVAQIEKYNSAVHTFQSKYGGLPGDIPDPGATAFGFNPRGPYPGQGDGNGVICGNGNNASNGLGSYKIDNGEAGMFWVDLTYANGMNVNLIDGSFHTATPTGLSGGTVSGSSIANYLPAAKIGGGNYIYVYTRGWGTDTSTNSFGLSAITQLGTSGFVATSNPGLSVLHAYSIDSKIDDGLPETGNVKALYLNTASGPISPMWAGTSASLVPPWTPATSASSTTCFDNGGVNGTTMKYSTAYDRGADLNCALSFVFQ